MYKKSFIFLFLASNFVFTFAQGCSLGGDGAPDPSSIACILSNIISIAIGVAGAIFVAMIAYGAIKLSMALGDPKGYAGAISTWQYALIGVGAVVGVYGILSIVGKLVGVDFSPGSLSGRLQGAINTLFLSLTQK
jgi:hypothetical protein